MKHQLFTHLGDEYVEAPSAYSFTFQHLKTSFKISFNPTIEKRNDLTLDPSQLLRINPSQIFRKTKGDNIEVNLSGLSKQDTFMTIKARIRTALNFIAQSENMADLPSVMSEKFVFSNEQGIFNSMDRIINASDQTNFELVRCILPDSDECTPSFGLYTHSNGEKEWRQCAILMKVNDSYKIEFIHERDPKQPNSYLFARENLLLSFDYKRSQDDYYSQEVRELLEKLDQEEVEISEIIKNQDMKGEVKKQLNFDNVADDAGLEVTRKDAFQEDLDE